MGSAALSPSSIYDRAKAECRQGRGSRLYSATGVRSGGVAWFATERFSIESVTRAVNAAAERLPVGGALARGFDWIYERTLGGAPGLDSAESLAADYRKRHGDAEAAITALIA